MRIAITASVPGSGTADAPELPKARRESMNGWYDVDDVATLLKVKPRTVQRWCRERRVPHVRVGRGIRFTAEQLAEIESMYRVGTQVHVDVSARNPAFVDRLVVVPVDPNLVRQQRAS